MPEVETPVLPGLALEWNLQQACWGWASQESSCPIWREQLLYQPAVEPECGPIVARASSLEEDVEILSFI